MFAYCAFLQRSLIVGQIILMVLGLSCGVDKPRSPQSPPDNVSSNLPRSSNENSGLENSGQQPNKTKQTTRSAIRQVDFRNFTFPWYPKSLTPPLRRREITLRNGNFEIGLEARQGITSITVDLEHVLYADLTQDGEEDALVYLAGSVPTNSFLGNLLVYTIDKGVLKVLWQHETGDRGNGGLRAFKVADGALIVEEYDPKVNPEQSLCCPKNFSRSFFRWTNGRFARVNFEVLPNQYSNAYFVGYPTE